MRALILMFSMACCSLTWASISGQGRATAGVSHDEQDFNAGFSAAYAFTGYSMYQNYTGALEFEETSNNDRPAPIIGHNYLYSGAYRAATLKHSLIGENPYLSWDTDGNFRENGDIALENNTSWFVRSGPGYTRNIRPDITLGVHYYAYQQDLNDYASTQQDGSVFLRKMLRPKTFLAVEYLHSCIDYNDEEVLDFCKNEYSLMFSSEYTDSKYDLRVNKVVKYGRQNITYEGNYSYFMNKANNLVLSYKKEDTNIPAAVLLDGIAPSDDISVIINTKTAKYNYAFQRIKFNADGSYIEYVAEQQSKKERRLQANAEYLTSGRLCQSCYAVIGYTSSNNEVMDWYSYSAGISLPFKREWSRSLFLRKTVHEDGENILSINFLVSYDGQASVLSR